jgi:hypothetical protein
LVGSRIAAEYFSSIVAAQWTILWFKIGDNSGESCVDNLE